MAEAPPFTLQGPDALGDVHLLIGSLIVNLGDAATAAKIMCEWLGFIDHGETWMPESRKS